MMTKIGDKFPDFNLKNQNGETISSEDLKGSKSIVYFYPRDNTPTCTTEACDFRDNLEDFNELNTKVYGISGDSEKKHSNFIKATTFIYIIPSKSFLSLLFVF